MIDDFSKLIKIFLETSVILLLMLFIFRRHLISAFDPLVFYLVTQAFSVELALLEISNWNYLVNFLSCECLFITGFFLFAGRPLEKGVGSPNNLFQRLDINVSVLKVFVVAVTLLLVLANLYLISQKGIALLAEDPSAAKGENFVDGGGLGIVRRMNWGVLYLCALLAISLTLHNRSGIYFFFTVILIFILLLTGSKGVLIYFIVLIPMLSSFKDIRSGRIFKWFNYSKYFFLAGGVLLSIVIISGSSETTTEQALFGLVTRFLFFGDAMLYYYDFDSVKHFSSLTFTDFLAMEINSVLGLLRLVPYQRPLGFELVEYKFSSYQDTVFGPNVPYYVKGHIFFGPIGALFYSVCVGATVGFVRKLYYNAVRKPGHLLVTLVIIHLNVVIVNFPQDSQLFLSVLFDTFFIAFPCYFILYCLLRRGVVNHRRHRGSVSTYGN